jgi:hypothetical protein
MKKISPFAIAILALSAGNLNAAEFTILTNADEILNFSEETVANAKVNYMNAVSDEAATEATKLAALHNYMQQSNPAPGYAYDMSWTMTYTAVTAENQGKYTQAALAENWLCDVEGSNFQALANSLHKEDGPMIRVYNGTAFKTEDSFNKLIAYQNVELAAGCYIFSMDAYAQGAANCAVVTAAGTDCAKAIAGYGSGAVRYTVDFTLDKTENVKLGVKRNDRAGNLTHIWYNNVELLKVSSAILVTPDYAEALTPAEDVDICFDYGFDADLYYAICLPFEVSDWAEYFENVASWNNFSDGTLSFSTIKYKNTGETDDKTKTDARKPYLVKFKPDVISNGRVTFKNVNVTKGNPGSWKRSVAEGEEPFPVFMQGNWGASVVPEGCYYFYGREWRLSDGTAKLNAFSAYIDATGFTTFPEILKTGGIDISLPSAVEDVAVAPNAYVTVFNIQGMAVKAGVPFENALDDLPTGLYIINGKKFVK